MRMKKTHYLFFPSLFFSFFFFFLIVSLLLLLLVIDHWDWTVKHWYFQPIFSSDTRSIPSEHSLKARGVFFNRFLPFRMKLCQWIIFRLVVFQPRILNMFHCNLLCVYIKTYLFVLSSQPRHTKSSLFGTGRGEGVRGKTDLLRRRIPLLFHVCYASMGS